MKRLHVHVAVADIEQSTTFYSSLFGAAPTVQKDDYAKWMLDDPRVNFAISARGREPGLDHLGIQAENDGELKEISTRLKSADMKVLDEGVGHLLLCQVRKGLDRRSARNRLGNISHHGAINRLWRRQRREHQRDSNGEELGLLRSVS